MPAVPPSLPTLRFIQPAPSPYFSYPVTPLRPELRYHQERLAKWLCISIGAIVLVLSIWVVWLHPDFLKILGPFGITLVGAAYWLNARAARVRGNAILVSEEHWPELHDLVQECQARLGLRGLKAYVVQDLVLEQAGMRLGGDDCLLLRASIVDVALSKGDIEALRFHIGRKCGQIAFGHYRYSSHTLAVTGRLIYPLFAWYRRCQERTADRAGLWVSGHRQLAHHGLAVLAAGVHIGGHLTPNAARAQIRASKHSLWVRLVGWHTERVFYPQRIVALDDAAKELGIPE